MSSVLGPNTPIQRFPRFQRWSTLSIALCRLPFALGLSSTSQGVWGVSRVIIEDRDCLRESRLCIEPDWVGVGGVEVPSASAESGSSTRTRGTWSRRGGVGDVGDLVSVARLTKEPNALNRSLLGDVGGFDWRDLG